jgi:hypothetical protein
VTMDRQQQRPEAKQERGGGIGAQELQHLRAGCGLLQIKKRERLQR